MSNEVFEEEPYTLECVPDQYMTQEMWNKIIHINPAVPYLVPDRFKTQEICIKVLKVGMWQVLEHVPDYFKTQDMCDKIVKKCPSRLVRDTTTNKIMT